MSLPLVSVHIITYNQIDFIRETLDSALSQDYHNLEIIVADDGSTDGTADVILEYANTHPTKIIPLVGGPNLGITGNSNRGLKACRGKYIAIMGGDDLFYPDKITQQIKIMEKFDDIAICYHDLNVFESSTGDTLCRFSEIAKPRCGKVITLIKHGCFVGATSALVRVSSMPVNGFDERIRLASDWLFWINCLESGGRIFYLNQVLGKYRRHNNNITSKIDSIRGSSRQDQFITCAILLSEYPEYANLIKKRFARTLLGSRLFNNRIKYREYLKASLKISFSIKVLIRYVFSFFGYSK
jgi:glycosyltransferase involved in cell wall biosynthesis